MQAHRLIIRVRYGESDQMGYAHHAAYVIWLESARIEFMRDLGESYRELEAGGILMPVVSCQLRYQRPVRFDDEIELQTTARAMGPSRVAFQTTVIRADVLCATGDVTVATVNRDGKPIRLPARLGSALAR